MGEVSPHFFIIGRLPRRDVKDALEDVVASELDAISTISLSSGVVGRRVVQLIEVRIDRRDGVSGHRGRLMRRRHERSRRGWTEVSWCRRSTCCRCRLQVSDRCAARTSGGGSSVAWANVLSPEHGGRFEGEDRGGGRRCGVGSRGAGAQAADQRAQSRWLPSRRRGLAFHL